MVTPRRTLRNKRWGLLSRQPEEHYEDDDADDDTRDESADV